jgi:hypothetical protein
VITFTKKSPFDEYNKTMRRPSSILGNKKLPKILLKSLLTKKNSLIIDFQEPVLL